MSAAQQQQPVAVITGAATGLGADMARLLKQQYQLVLIDRDPIQLEPLQLTPNEASCYQCDLSDRAAVTQLLAQLRASYSEIAMLINNAGITHRSLSVATDFSVIERVMQVDYFAPVMLSQGLLSELRQGQGLVVNISSMAGWMPVLGRAGYCAAKAALHQYFETFRSEVREQGVGVLMVYPSFVETNIEANALSGNGGKAQHPRSVTGRVVSSTAMARSIVKAIAARQERLFPDRFTYWSSVLYRLAPKLFHRLMRRRFGSELRAN